MSHRHLVLAALVVAVTLVACTGDDSPAPPAGGAPTPLSGGAVTLGVLGDPPTLDPYSPRATDLTHTLVRPVYPTLFRFGPDGSIRPYLARSLDEVEDGARVRLEKMAWSNGRAITADDVAASARRASSPSPLARLRIRATAPRTLELRGRVNDWEQALATPAFVLPGGRAGAGGPFGGPFVVESYRRGFNIVYARNPQWSGESAYLRRVEVQFGSALAILTTLLEDRRLDAALLPSTVNLEQRLQENEINFRTALGWESVYVDFRSSGLSRPQRAAFVRAIDRSALEEGLVRPGGRIADSLHPGPGNGAVAPGSFESVGGRAAAPQRPVLLLGPAGDELLGLIQRVLQGQLHAADIDLQLAVAEPSAVYGGGEGFPRGVVIRRSLGAPGRTDGPNAVRSLDAFPLFHVETVVAFPPELNGVAVNPTIEGPLWNAERWWWSPRI